MRPWRDWAILLIIAIPLLLAIVWRLSLAFGL